MAQYVCLRPARFAATACPAGLHHLILPRPAAVSLACIPADGSPYASEPYLSSASNLILIVTASFLPAPLQFPMVITMTGCGATASPLMVTVMAAVITTTMMTTMTTLIMMTAAS